MGKNKGRGALSGLSRFVESFKSFQTPSEPKSPNPAASSKASNETRDELANNLPGPLSCLNDYAEEKDEEPPSKKRKNNDGDAVVSKQVVSNGAWIEKYDASGLVPHYTHISEVPEHLQKYFSQRTRFFSLYSEYPGCLLDEEGWFSVTPELVADQIAERCRCDTILDAFCGVGGNTIAFAKTCQRVIALDTSPTRLALARHNAQIYGVADRIEFILMDYISFANTYLKNFQQSASSTSESPDSYSQNSSRKIDVIFLSPPWGGPSYLDGSPPKPSSSDTRDPPTPTLTPTPIEAHPTYSLSSIQPMHGAELFRLTRKITKNVAYYLPRNTTLEEISDLLESEGNELGGKNSIPNGKTTKKAGKRKANGKQKEDQEAVEIEEEWMGNKLKALTCYFGGLAAGQEAMF